MNCIDVSQWQGVIDWDAVKPHVGGAILRAGYGKGHPDGQFARNAAACNRLGIPCGAYWFSYASTPADARAEAEHLLAAVKPYRMELPLCFDFEYDSVSNAEKQGTAVTKALASELVRAFCGRIEEEGYWALNYANPDFLSRYYDADVQKRYGLWLAQWTSTDPLASPSGGGGGSEASDGEGASGHQPSQSASLTAPPEGEPSDGPAALPVPPRPCAVWQYSSRGSVPGIEGRVDMDLAYTDFPAVMRARGLNRLGNGDGALALARRLGLPPDEAVTGLSLARALLVLRDSKDDADAHP